MKQTTQRFSGIFLALLILLLAGIGFFEFVQPEYANLMSLRAQEQSESDFLSVQQKLADQAQKVYAQYASQSSSTQAINLALPLGPDSAGALAQIYGIATNSGISIVTTGISLSAAPQNQAAIATSADGSTAQTAAALIKPDGSLTFQIAATGSYEALKAFLQGIETNVRVFDVTQLTIHPVGTVTTAGVSQNGSQDLYNYNMTLVAYYQSK